MDDEAEAQRLAATVRLRDEQRRAALRYLTPGGFQGLTPARRVMLAVLSMFVLLVLPPAEILFWNRMEATWRLPVAICTFCSGAVIIFFSSTNPGRRWDDSKAGVMDRLGRLAWLVVIVCRFLSRCALLCFTGTVAAIHTAIWAVWAGLLSRW
ncbi:hypothetical protein Agub_g8009 [Astrephomene gubernaculifera]|uniref:Uncharacterized protein n=1 Tax=Astrephomene gubernaculifera TaxID=47775 RepID=A0AAD3DQZ6_9CHLO|nr:hypothetical protein Agub_g8009 [Astrephomene gubernaculifera]